MRLSGKVALVTGVGSGSGRAIALGFAREGALVAVADVKAEAARATATVEAAGVQALALTVDVHQCEEVVARVVFQNDKSLAHPCYNGCTSVLPSRRYAVSTTIIMEPDIQQKLAILGGEASDEVTDVPATQSIQQGITHATGFIYNAKQEGGGTSQARRLQRRERLLRCEAVLRTKRQRGGD
jgi:NAD(P)-dependent dehydrogenase (short-subunit alcohol dehydrogenase family)